ncbi:unnamed protein product [Mytilus edulis]|uniref:Death domain-containing protein n=2 Tax=Mytilus edulis TaxID=6550 RepID=A0A8S3Q4N9_MYTED|nr:unnamed protein product [Mytilus edulis]
MTDQVVLFAMKQNSWGQRRPMQWVPLELQISKMRMKNVNIISKEDLLHVNMLNRDLALDEHQLNAFLLVQHSLGKLMYYDLDGLNQFIIIHPPALVNILRSFVTDEKFFPANPSLKAILQNMTDTGKIYKQDLLQLWQQDHFHQYMQDDSIKDFVIQLLIYLDILIIPKASKQISHVYLVPCMIKAPRPSSFNVADNQGVNTICLRYTLARSSIPTSLAYKIIGASISAWPLKVEDNKPCLYHKAALFNVSEDNELRIWLKDNRVLVNLTNSDSLLSLSPDIAASVQECLTNNIESCLLFHYNSFGRKLKRTQISDLYTMEIGTSCENSVCFTAPEHVMMNERWTCGNGKVHDTRYLRFWLFNKSQQKCGPECKGLNDNELKTAPSDKHLVRLGCQIGIRAFDNFFIQLGMDRKALDTIEYTYASHSPGDIMSMALIQWKNSKIIELEDPTLKELADALHATEMDSHLICQVFREKAKLLEIADLNLQVIPSDQHLKILSNHIGNCPFQLGIELGLSYKDVKQSLFSFPRNLPGLVESILAKWKKNLKVTTIHSLIMALGRVDAGGFKCLLETSKCPCSYLQK